MSSEAFTSELANLTIHDAGFVELPSGVQISKLPVWDHCHDVFARVGWEAAGEWLAERGMRLPTPAEYDELHELAVFVAPYTMPTVSQLKRAGIPTKNEAHINTFRNANMRSLEWCKQHDEAVWARLKRVEWTDQPVANAGKHWAEPLGTIYGWYVSEAPNLKRIQNARDPNAHNFPPHGGGYTDYATTIHAVRDDSVQASPPPSSGTPSSPSSPDTEPSSGDEELPIPEPSSEGDKGLHVVQWQRYLLDYFAELGAEALPNYGDDGHHGEETTQWTERWRKLEEAGGEVIEVVELTSSPPSSAPELVFELEALPFIESVNYTRWTREPAIRPVDLVVIHDMEYPEKLDAAEAVARWFGSPSRAPQASAHVCVDADSAVLCVPLNDVAWHAGRGGNANTIGIEHAGYARQSEAEWLDDYSRPMLELSALITAELCRRYNIPAELVDEEGVKAGRRGICGHRHISFAFRHSTHTDPGPEFPWDWYLEQVRNHL